MMETLNFDTLVEALNHFNKEGFDEDFMAESSAIKGLKNKQTYEPEELTMTSHYRFEEMTNPGDATELLVIEANDGTKGTLVMSYGAKHSHNEEMIKRMKQKT